MRSPYITLGIPEDSALEIVDKAYERLSARLAVEFDSLKAKEQARKCLKSIADAKELIHNEKRLQEYKHNRELAANQLDYKTRPRLGQICVASGIISMEQLNEAVEAHLESGEPLGEILESMHALSRTELDGLLMGQDLIDIDSECNDPIGIRLINLNLASEDMALIAQMQQRIMGTSTLEIFLSHKWIEPEIAEAFELH